MNAYCFRVKSVLQTASIVIAALMVSGCGSVVYKDAATTYVVAGRAATKSITDASVTLAAAQDKLRASRLVADAMCPIGEPRIFLREKEADTQFKAALSRMPNMPRTSDCRSLSACEERPNGYGCTSICYSAAEANCIATIEENAAKTLKELSGSGADQFAAATRPLGAALNRIEYGRAVPIQNALVKVSLDALAEYLDLLDKLATKRDSEVEADAKKLSAKLTSAVSKLTELTGQKLSDADKATQTKTTNALTAMGKFVSDMKTISDNSTDAVAIRKIVAEHHSDVDQLIASVKEVAIGDAMLGAVYKNVALVQVRQDLQSRYAMAGNAYDRRLLLEERDKYVYPDGTQVQASVSALFDSMAESHRALVQLVMHPSDKDLQDLANARVQEFKTIAEDVAVLVQLFT